MRITVYVNAKHFDIVNVVPLTCVDFAAREEVLFDLLFRSIYTIMLKYAPYHKQFIKKIIKQLIDY